MAVPSSTGWITTSEAAQRLGVKRATLYAYVSRGVLRSRRQPGQQESLFDRSQIDGLATSTRKPGTPQPLLRFRSVATSVSSHHDGGFQLRGIDIEDVVELYSVEEAIRLVLGSVPESGTPAAPPSGFSDLIASMPLGRRVPAAMMALGAADPVARQLDTSHVATSAHRAIHQAAALLSGASSSASLGANVFEALAGRPGTRRELDCLATVLIVLMDHGLTASTIAARVAASTRAPFYDCLLAAYATMAGPLHGGAPRGAHELIRLARETRDPAAAITTTLQQWGSVPGFGHLIYSGPDPRAAPVLGRLWRLPGTGSLRRTVEECSAVVLERSGWHPNLDLAIGACLHALDLDPNGGEVLFQLARSVGVVAHVMEEYTEQPLRWRGQETQG